MHSPAHDEVGLTFEGAGGSRMGAVRRAVLAVPALAGSGFIGCEIAFESSSSTLLLNVSLAGAGADASVQRLRFWCARAGGFGVAGAAGDVVRRAWHSRLGACTTMRQCSTAHDLGAALDAMLGRAPPGASAAERPTLDVDVSGPGCAGMAFNPHERLLFIPGLLAPPPGDELELAVRTSATPDGPARCCGRVVRVRGVAQRPGAPAGFVLQLGAAPPHVLEALATSCASMNADALVEEARRSAPRFAVHIDVEIQRGSVPGTATAGHAVSLSIGGAFIKTPTRPPPGSSVLLRFRTAHGEGLTTLATVVYATSAGVGVMFHPDRREEAALCGLVARISARPRRVLVVDDDGLVRRMHGDALAALGYEVLTASSGEEAVRILANELYALDAIVTDLGMDGMDGSQLVQAVNSARDHVDITIVVVSGRLEGEIAQRLLRAGADAAFDKALDPERLARHVDALVARRRPASPDRSRMTRVLALSLCLVLASSLGCSPTDAATPAHAGTGREISRQESHAVAPMAKPTLCEAASQVGFRCSLDGVLVFDGPQQPRVELLTECEAAARIGKPCAGREGFVFSVEY